MYPKVKVNVVKGIGILVLLLAPFYLISIYNEFFEDRPGYIYDPNSEQLYRLRLGPSIYRHEHWKRHLIPFLSPHFSNIVFIERAASLNEEIIRLSGGPGHKSYKQNSGKNGVKDIEFLDAEAWARYDLDLESLLPAQWSQLPITLDDSSGQVFPVDAVITKRRHKGKGPIDIKIIRGALFLADQAAYAVNTYCFHSNHENSWEECRDRK